MYGLQFILMCLITAEGFLFPQVYFVAPPVVRMKDDIKQFLTEQGVPWVEVRG